MIRKLLGALFGANENEEFVSGLEPSSVKETISAEPDEVLKGQAYEAAIRGDYQELEVLLSSQPDLVNATNDDGLPLLALALANLQEESVKSLIANGADINAQLHAPAPEARIIHFLTASGTAEAVHMAVQHGADACARDSDGSTPLLYAITAGRADIVHMLLELGADSDSRTLDGRSVLMEAIMAGNTDVVTDLLAHGADPNVSDQQGRTALAMMCHEGRRQIVQLLLDYGADPDTRVCPAGLSALDLAVINGDCWTIKLLLAKGAAVNEIAGDGVPTIYRSVDAGPEVVALIVDGGADINASTVSKQHTALHKAAMLGMRSVVVELLRKGADPRIVDCNGQTALHCAAQRSADICALLVEHGADVDVRDHNGTTPMLLAVIEGLLPAVETLLAVGADTESRDNRFGATALYLASILGKSDMVRLLVSRGAEVNVRDNQGNTPLSKALQEGHMEVAQVLMSHGAQI